MELLIFSTGEGRIVEKLLVELFSDNTLKGCPKILDRPLVIKGKKLVVFSQNPDPTLRELLKTISQMGEVEIYSSNCGDLENCYSVEGFYPLKALERFLENIGETQLAEALKNFTPSGDANETLSERLSFYIPLVVAKRKSVAFAWKYYLTLKGIPAVTFTYPSEGENVLEILSNVGFRDKVFPLLLGKFEDKFLEEVKNRGFVPYEVTPKTDKKLLMELELIYTAKEVSERIFKP